MARVIERLRHCWSGSVDIAVEEGYGRYFAGIIRDSSHGIDLHAHYAPYYARGYLISKINAEISWNLYVEQPAQGGQTTVYNSPWAPVVHGDEIAENHPLDPMLVAGAESYTFEPTAGDVVVFNNRNPHQVAKGDDPDGKNRLHIASFIGRLPKDELILWS